MNKQNIIYTTNPGGDITAEWCDRATDDDDRYAKDSIIITAHAKFRKDERHTRKDVNTALTNAYDAWVFNTRGR